MNEDWKKEGEREIETKASRQLYNNNFTSGAVHFTGTIPP